MYINNEGRNCQCPNAITIDQIGLKILFYRNFFTPYTFRADTHIRGFRYLRHVPGF